MSLWRVRSGLSPSAELLAVLMAALVGVWAIAVQTFRPFAVQETALVSSVPEPISLDPASWTRRREFEYGYEYGVPPGWVTAERGFGRTEVARAAGYLNGLDPDGAVMSIEIRPLGLAPEELAAQEFAGHRTALYDVTVDGRTALFAVASQDRRISLQAVYVPITDGRVLIARGDGLDPSVFSVFVSSIKFFTP